MFSYRCIASHPLRRPALAAAVGMLSLAFFAPASQAQVTFNLGSGAAQPEENVLLNDDQVGTVITGVTNNTNTTVLFTQVAPPAPEELVAPSNGQARIEATDGLFTNLRTSLLLPGYTFTEFEANANIAGKSALFTIGYLDSNNTALTQQYTFGNGENFFSVVATNGFRLQYVDILGPENGLQDVRQIRIGGIADADGTPVVPEPSEWLAMGMATASVGGLIVRGRVRRRRTGGNSVAA